MVKPHQECPTVLLSDTPTLEDAFGHDSIAQTLADVISTETGGRSIGLTGPWGSGKSTVVELVQKHLTAFESEQLQMFVFDAWAHQGDPLRRSFLERLIAFLRGKGWLTRATYWQQRVEELAMRRETTDTETTPLLTGWGLAVVFSLMLLPLGIALTSSHITDYGTDGEWGVIGLLMTCAPFAVALAAWIYERFKARDENHRPTNIAALFLSKTRERVFTTKLQTAEPTSIEFQALYIEAIREALKEPHRKLIIVVDNLDRVEAADALKVWSTLRTFFDSHANEVDAQLERVWVLVPFDSGAVRKLWNGEFAGNWDGLVGDIPAEQSFIDKTFQIILHVPRPVLSSWDIFFRQQLRQALPKHTEDEFHLVIRIFDAFVVGTGDSPTPRDIKLFVNAIGTLHRRWQHEISLTLFSLYTALTRKQRNLGSELALSSDNQLIGNLSTDILGRDWRRDLAAIHFNVQPEMAMQVLLAPKVNEAIRVADTESISEMARLPGFVRVLEQIIEHSARAWAESEPRTLLNAVRVIDQIPQTVDPGWQRVWLQICFAALSLKAFTPQTSDGGAIARLIRRTPALAKSLIGSLSISLPESAKPGDPAAATRETSTTWLSVVADVMLATHEEGVNDAAKALVVPGSPTTYVLIASIAGADNRFAELRPYLRPQISAEFVMNELIRIASSGGFGDDQYAAVKTMLCTGTAWQWESLVSALNPRLLESGALGANELWSILLVLRDLAATTPAARQLLMESAAGGYLQHHLGLSKSSIPAAAACVWCLIYTNPDGVLRRAITNNSHEGANLFNAICQAPQQYAEIMEQVAILVSGVNGIEDLYTLGAEHPNLSVLADYLVRYFAVRPDATTNITPAAIVQNRALFQRALGDDFSAFVRDFTVNAGLVQALISSDYRPEDIELYLLVLRSASNDGTLSNHLAAPLRRYDKQRWLSLLVAESVEMDLALELNKAGVLHLSTPFGDALEQHAQGMLGGTTKLLRLKNQWVSLLDLLDASSRTVALRRILDDIIASTQPTDSVLETYGDQLAKSNVVSHGAERLVITGFGRMLERNNDVELRWVHSVLKSNPKLLSSVTHEAAADFRSRLESSLAREVVSGERTQLLENIASFVEPSISRLPQTEETII